MKWRILNEVRLTPPEKIKVNDILYTLLKSRGIRDDEIENFLNPALKNLHSPYLFGDMERAIERIYLNINRGKPILLHGDYDVDGISGVSLLYRAIKKMGGKIFYYIPHRLNEGYGLSMKGIEYAQEVGADLVITVDCGISGVDVVNYARERGIDIVITDHHLPKDKVPQAFAIINPKTDENYPFKYLAGVGVAFKLAQALLHRKGYDMKEFLLNLDLVALGTIADVVPMTGENRVLTFNGLKIMNRTRNYGLRALMEVSGIDPPIKSYHIGFVLGPRINALGRLSQASDGVKLLTTYDQGVAMDIARRMDFYNKERQGTEKEILQTALDRIEELGLNKEYGIVLWDEEWHQGVIGIVASRIVERFYRPTILFSVDGDFAKGSGRSIPSVNLFEALYSIKQLIDEFGGHKEAAGLVVRTKNLEKFREAFNKQVKEHISEEAFEGVLNVDMEINVDEITESTYDMLRSLEPFGPYNPQPLFVIRGAKVVGYPENFSGNHIKFRVMKGSTHRMVMGFNAAEHLEFLKRRPIIDLAVNFIKDRNGEVKLKLVDLKKSKGGKNVD